MLKVLPKLMVIISLASIGLAGLWLNFISHPGPVQAREALFDYTAAPAARPLSAGFNITVSEIVAQGFTIPIQVTNAGDGSGRLFVVEQNGRIKIVKNGVVLGTPFLDISSIVRSPSDGGGGEEGLLGLAFHPNYETNGFFYVYYDDNNSDIVIARYSVSGNPDVANPSSAVTVLPIGHPGQFNHNGGQLAFSPLDGFLYIGTGDGGGSGDPGNNGQNINTLLGKILRLNVTGVTPYTIPPTNPYVGVSGDDRIWSIGLRNPWRYSFDRANGDLYIGDVGQGTWEEISYQAGGTAGGINFGWDVREGPCPQGQAQPCASAPAQFTDPIAFYANAGDNIAVTGGFVYRGSRYPALYGYYFYADFGSGRIWSMTKTGPTTWSTPEQELDTNFNISAFGEDEQGELYVVDYGNGQIRRLADVNGSSTSLAASQKTASGPGIDPGETLTYTILIKNTNGLTSSETAFLTDQIPAGLAYVPGSLVATQGSVDDSLDPTLQWQGPLSPTAVVTVTYRVTATGSITGLLINRAVITTANAGPITRTFPIFVPRPLPVYLPRIYKQ